MMADDPLALALLRPAGGPSAADLVVVTDTGETRVLRLTASALALLVAQGAVLLRDHVQAGARS